MLFNQILAESLLTQGQQLAKQGQFDESMARLDQAVELAPEYSGLYLHKGLILWQQQQIQPAVDMFNLAISKDPDNPATYLFSGILYYDIGQFDQAIHAFGSVLTRCPDNPVAICFNALTQIVKKVNMDQALSTIAQHVHHANSDFQSRLLVFCESQIRNYRSTARYLDESFFVHTYLEPTGLAAHLFRYVQLYLARINTCVAYPFSSKWKKAWRDYGIGLKALFRKRLDLAENAFRQALEWIPEFEAAWDKLLDIYFFQKKYDKVHEMIRLFPKSGRILPLDSENATIPNHLLTDGHQLPFLSILGVYYFHVGQWDLASRLFDAIGNVVTDYYHYYYRGLCSLENHDPVQARIWFQKAVELPNPNLAGMRLEEMMRVEYNSPGVP